jgi:hypothetical protein
MTKDEAQRSRWTFDEVVNHGNFQSKNKIDSIAK